MGKSRGAHTVCDLTAVKTRKFVDISINKFEAKSFLREVFSQSSEPLQTRFPSSRVAGCLLLLQLSRQHEREQM
jgi:hypothetical protein